jgi:hypothetical protein
MYCFYFAAFLTFLRFLCLLNGEETPKSDYFKYSTLFTSVADPGCLSRILDTGSRVDKMPDPGSGSANKDTYTKRKKFLPKPQNVWVTVTNNPERQYVTNTYAFQRFWDILSMLAAQW